MCYGKGAARHLHSIIKTANYCFVNILVLTASVMGKHSKMKYPMYLMSYQSIAGLYRGQLKQRNE